jgi:Domain of Unknown Function (DUF928)
MKSPSTAIALSALLILVAANPARSAESKAGTPAGGGQSQSKENVGSPSFPVYRPPVRGAPGGRVGGGTRGYTRDTFVLSVLAPDHMGLTVSEQPSLYWAISNATTLPVELAVMDPRKTEPVLEKRLPSPVTAGVHRIRLADYGVRLDPGVAYRWSVTVVPDANRRSRDILAGATIERVETEAELREKVGRSEKDRLPFLYAESGLWYDALAAISELIETAPQDSALQKQRDALLSQAGLPQFDWPGR